MVTAITAALPPVTYVPAAQRTQVQTLYQQGVSPAKIAAILGLSPVAVYGYLLHSDV
jgi:predicted transcriptional regulator